MQIPVHSRFKKEHISRNLGHLKLSFADGRNFNLGGLGGGVWGRGRGRNGGGGRTGSERCSGLIRRDGLIRSGEDRRALVGDSWVEKDLLLLLCATIFPV